MKILDTIFYIILKFILKFFSIRNIDNELKFLNKSVDYGNSLLGKGSTSIQPQEEVKKLKFFLDNDIDIAIDVGGNIGKYSNLLLSNFNVKKLYVFEPSKKSYEKLIKNISQHENVEFLNQGLSNKDTSQSLYGDSPGSSKSSIYKRRLDHFNLKFNYQEEIQLVKFDHFYKEKLSNQEIDIMKLDVEGHELDVLEGARKTIQSIKIIQFEFGGCNIDSKTFFQDFYYFFKDFNFDIYRMRPNGLSKIKNYSESDEYFHYSNFLSVNKNLI